MGAMLYIFFNEANAVLALPLGSTGASGSIYIIDEEQ